LRCRKDVDAGTSSAKTRFALLPGHDEITSGAASYFAGSSTET
jgi:hypothetical protein